MDVPVANKELSKFFPDVVSNIYSLEKFLRSNKNATLITAFKVAAEIKIKCMKHILKMPIGKVNDIGSGKLRKIVTESAGATEDFLAHKLVDFIVAIVTPICMIVILFAFDWKLGLVSLIPTILGFLAMSKMTGKAMVEDMKKYQNSMEEMNNEAIEYIRGVPVVKTFGQTIFTFNRFKKSIDDYDTFCISYTKKCRKPMLMFTLFINSEFAFLMATTLIISTNGSITNEFILNLIFYIIYTPIIATTMTRIMFVGEELMTVNDSLERINSILSIPPLRTGRNENGVMNNSIELENVLFSYENNDIQVLKDISLKIPSNSLVAFIGPSGGGKSTVANLITRFYDVNTGKIKIGGVDVRDISKEELSNLVSFVFQDSKLLKTSILENVRTANPKATNKEVREALKLAQCDDILEKLPNGINTIYGSKGVYLSGGEMQRINIARVILKNSPIVILDEATASLDAENETEVQGATQVREKCPDALSIFIVPSTMEELEKRIRGRRSEPEEIVQQRLAKAANEMKLAKDYKYVICNEEPQLAADMITLIIKHAMSEQEETIR